LKTFIKVPKSMQQNGNSLKNILLHTFKHILNNFVNSRVKRVVQTWEQTFFWYFSIKQKINFKYIFYLWIFNSYGADFFVCTSTAGYQIIFELASQPERRMNILHSCWHRPGISQSRVLIKLVAGQCKWQTADCK